MSPQNDLPELKVEGLPKATLEKLGIIKKLLPDLTSLSVVSEFLKSKGLPHSAGSWEDMWEKRIVPNLHSQKLTIADLVRRLGEAEEFGRSHVFLYSAKRKDAETCIDKIDALCQKLGYSKLLSDPLVVDFPKEITLTEIRTETDNDQVRCVFKLVEPREERVFVKETKDGNRIIREWILKEVRAVHVARLHASGLLEIRIQSHMNSTKYDEDLNSLRMLLKDFLPPKFFSPFPLAKAKALLWQEKEALKKKIRFSNSTMTNNFGTTLMAFTGAEEADLFADKGATGSIDHFLGDGGHCDSSNVWWRPVDGQIDREIHMLLSGLNNEFAITANCTKLEYEYVLNELRVHSK